MSLLEKDITRKRQVDKKALLEPKKDIKFEAKGNKEYKVKIIIDSAMYGQQANNNQIPGFYYLILWKGYSEEKNIWDPSLVVIHLWKLINTFYKKYLEKLTATFLPLYSFLSMARPTVPKELKQKHGRPGKKANKRSKN